jgi:hypothetical protein
MLRAKGRGRQVRRILRRRARPCRWPTAPPSPTWRRNTARPAASSRSTTRPALPAQHRPRRGAHRAGRGLCQGKRHLARRGLRAGLYRHAEPRHGHHRARHLRPQAAAGLHRADRCARKAFAFARPITRGDGRDLQAPGQHPTSRWPSKARTTRWNGKVVIASITSLHQHLEPLRDDRRGPGGAQGARAGPDRKPWVKTSLAPGSQVVSRLSRGRGPAGRPRRQIGFNLVGYGCTTCIGNSGPLQKEISKAINEGDLIATSVLSGNRNFEGRISPTCAPTTSPRRRWWWPMRWRAHEHRPHHRADRQTTDGKDVYLKDIWPTRPRSPNWSRRP